MSPWSGKACWLAGGKYLPSYAGVDPGLAGKVVGSVDGRACLIFPLSLHILPIPLSVHTDHNSLMTRTSLLASYCGLWSSMGGRQLSPCMRPGGLAVWWLLEDGARTSLAWSGWSLISYSNQKLVVAGPDVIK